eukprot:scaffold334_cov241-Pinguiococcus_pyrenoidosus.AAC.10
MTGREWNRNDSPQRPMGLTPLDEAKRSRAFSGHIHGSHTPQACDHATLKPLRETSDVGRTFAEGLHLCSRGDPPAAPDTPVRPGELAPMIANSGPRGGGWSLLRLTEEVAQAEGKLERYDAYAGKLRKEIHQLERDLGARRHQRSEGKGKVRRRFLAF